MEKQKRNEFKHLWHWSVCVRVCPHSHRHACIHACTLLKCQGKAVLCLWQYHLLEVFICVQPVIPMFTENCREVFRTPQFGRSMCMWGGGACVCVCVCACVCVCVCVCVTMCVCVCTHAWVCALTFCETFRSYFHVMRPWPRNTPLLRPLTFSETFPIILLCNWTSNRGSPLF